MTPSGTVSIGARFRSVRKASNRLQRDFVAQLNEASRALFGGEGPRFDASRISKLENERQTATIEDVAIYATVDPLHRGKLWLAWGEAVDTTLPAPVATPPALPRLRGRSVTEQLAAQEAEKPARNGGKGGEKSA